MKDVKIGIFVGVHALKTFYQPETDVKSKNARITMSARDVKNTRRHGMKLRYKHIHFVEVEKKPKTSVWECRNNSSTGTLGEIKWYGPWRQYCYFPTVQAVYSVGCFEDINAFIGQLRP